MTFSSNSARPPVSRRSAHKVAALSIAACLALAGCSLFQSKPAPPSPQQMAAYAEQQAALRRSGDLAQDASQQRCEELVAATPGVEELRNNHGSIESRQWTLLPDGSAPRWAFVKAADSAPDGWAPKPGIDRLDFHPPLEPVLTPGASYFLAYAPAERDSLEESRKSAAANALFGAAQGYFTWRGRKYSYTLTSQLPCFPRLN